MSHSWLPIYIQGSTLKVVWCPPNITEDYLKISHEYVTVIKNFQNRKNLFLCTNMADACFGPVSYC